MEKDENASYLARYRQPTRDPFFLPGFDDDVGPDFNQSSSDSEQNDSPNFENDEGIHQNEEEIVNEDENIQDVELDNQHQPHPPIEHLNQQNLQMEVNEDEEMQNGDIQQNHDQEQEQNPQNANDSQEQAMRDISPNQSSPFNNDHNSPNSDAHNTDSFIDEGDSSDNSQASASSGAPSQNPPPISLRQQLLQEVKNTYSNNNQNHIIPSTCTNYKIFNLKKKGKDFVMTQNPNEVQLNYSERIQEHFENLKEKFDRPLTTITTSQFATIFDLILVLFLFYFSFHVIELEMVVILKIISKLFKLDLPNWNDELKDLFLGTYSTCFVCKHPCKAIYFCRSKHKNLKCPQCGKSLADSWFHYKSSLEYLEMNLKNPKYVEPLIESKSKDKEYQQRSVNWQAAKESFCNSQQQNELDLAIDVNTDGVPVRKGISCWPVFCSISNIAVEQKKSTPYNPIIAMVNQTYSDVEFDAITYLIVQDLLTLMKGVTIGQFFVKAFLQSLIMDLPGRAEVLQMMAYNGYESCVFCYVHGIKNQGTATFFPLGQERQRTKRSIISDVLLKQCGFEDGKFSQFFRLPYFSPNIHCAIDFMHSVLLGIANKLVNSLHEHTSPFYLTPHNFEGLEMIVSNIKIPQNFHRSISGLKNLKAIELYLIIIYCSGVFFGVSDILGNLFQYLHDITVICFQETISEPEIDQLFDTCIDFLSLYQQTFGRDNMFHNFHLLLHLWRDLLLLGPAWTHTMFTFESFNHLLNTNIHTNYNFERKAITCHSAEALIDNLIRERGEEFPLIKELASEIESSRERSEPPLSVDGINVSTQTSQYTSWVQLDSGEKGQIMSNKLDSIWFSVETDNSRNDFEITEDRIQNVLVKSYRLASNPNRNGFQSSPEWIVVEKNPLWKLL